MRDPKKERGSSVLKELRMTAWRTDTWAWAPTMQKFGGEDDMWQAEEWALPGADVPNSLVKDEAFWDLKFILQPIGKGTCGGCKTSYNKVWYLKRYIWQKWGGWTEEGRNWWGKRTGTALSPPPSRAPANHFQRCHSVARRQRQCLWETDPTWKSAFQAPAYGPWFRTTDT